MKRVSGLWESLTSWDNLYEAAHRAAAGKRRRPDVAAYLLGLENEVARLRRTLLDGKYRPGPYRSFVIREPKERLISAAPFRHRVVHHALTQVIEPVFEPRFTTRSFASRRGFGTHQAVALAIRACRRYRYVLKCDIRKYFPSIDHVVLKGKLRQVLKCEPTLALAELIIDGSNPQEEIEEYFAGDTLFTPHERRRGLPLGNQTSQFFANVYLNSLDHLVLRELRPGEYARYVDDFVLFSDSKSELRGMREEIDAHLDSLRLRVHERKSRIYRTADGLTFLGWQITPQGVWLKRDCVVRMRRRLRFIERELAAGRMEWAEVRQRVCSWIGHAQWGNTWKLREQMFNEVVFLRACVD